ncbi:MAG TPA: hypothetical protein VD833_10340 [Vicinamibacterales bacterium]|nr:hypothetical protein [Vicinamibacterales bacterium]
MTAVAPDAHGRYVSRAAAHARARAVEQARSVRISRMRLATFLPALGLLAWTLARGVTPGPLVAALTLLAAFAALVVWHARVEARVAWFDALRTVCNRGVARLQRDWARLPPGEPPAGVDPGHHPYAQDLDLFGRASLFQWLGPAATPGGARILADWLLMAAPPAEVRERQQAVAALAPLEVWREELAAHGVLAASARQIEIDRFLAWAEGGELFGARAGLVRIAVVVILVALWAGIGLHAAGVVDVAIWSGPLLAGIVLSFALAGRVSTALDRADAGEHALQRYAGLFEHAVAVPGQAPRLGAIRDQLRAEHATAPACMRRLNRILAFGELRRGAALLHFPVQALTLWDFHVVFALERWRRHTGSHVRSWLAALADLDALAVLAGLQCDNPAWTVPVFVPEPVLDAHGLGHPLLDDGRRVANDLTIGPPGSIVLVTGSNMSGKSTLLRSIGLNVVLAQAGAAVCADRLALPACDLQTSIRVQDSLELGLSYFMAALGRLKGVVDAAEHERGDRVLLYLLDEVLQGTNSVERAIAVRAVARHLLEAGAIGAMTTHDLGLAAEDPLKSSARLVHFTETVDESGAMRFDYRLRPGLATSRNALRLMQLIGIEV